MSTVQEAIAQIIDQPTYQVEYQAERDNPTRATVSMRSIVQRINDADSSAALHPLVEYIANITVQRSDHIMEKLERYIEQYRAEFEASEGTEHAELSLHSDTSVQIAQLLSVYLMSRVGSPEQIESSAVIFDWVPNGGFTFELYCALNSTCMTDDVFQATKDYEPIAKQLQQILTLFSSIIFQSICVANSSDSSAENSEAEDDEVAEDNEMAE